MYVSNQIDGSIGLKSLQVNNSIDPIENSEGVV